MVNIVLSASELEAMCLETLTAGDRLLDERRGRGGVALWVVSDNRVNPIGYGCDQAPEEVTGHALRDLLVELYEGELEGAVDCKQEIKSALPRVLTSAIPMCKKPVG